MLTGSLVVGHWRKQCGCHLSWCGEHHLPVLDQLGLHVILLFAKYNIIHDININRLRYYNLVQLQFMCITRTKKKKKTFQ